MEGAGSDAREEGVAVVQAGGDKGVNEAFSGSGREAVSDFGNVAEMEVGGLNNGANMRVE